MSNLDDARAQVDMADLVIATMVEGLRQSEGADGYANGLSVAGLIGGAPPMEVLHKLRKLAKLGVLERSTVLPTYQLTHLGVELLSQDVGNFQQSPREESRRNTELLQALNS